MFFFACYLVKIVKFLNAVGNRFDGKKRLPNVLAAFLSSFFLLNSDVRIFFDFLVPENSIKNFFARGSYEKMTEISFTSFYYRKPFVFKTHLGPNVPVVFTDVRFGKIGSNNELVMDSSIRAVLDAVKYYRNFNNTAPRLEISDDFNKSSLHLFFVDPSIIGSLCKGNGAGDSSEIEIACTKVTPFVYSYNNEEVKFGVEVISVLPFSYGTISDVYLHEVVGHFLLGIDGHVESSDFMSASRTSNSLSFSQLDVESISKISKMESDVQFFHNSPFEVKRYSEGMLDKLSQLEQELSKNL